MKKILALTAVGIALVGTMQKAEAQTPSASDILALSQYNYSFGTARSAALGGAFTSLGADLSSMSINPAGLGMYRTSDFGFTSLVSATNIESTYHRPELGGVGAASFRSNDSRTRYSVGNLGLAVSLFKGGGTVTSVTFGVGYNQLANFNTNSYAGGSGFFSSIAEDFAERMNGVNPGIFNTENTASTYRSLGIHQWGGGLAYETAVLNYVGNNQYSAFHDDIDFPDEHPAVLSENMTVNPGYRNLTRGSVGEYAISAGMNLQNKLYLGMTIGIQDVHRVNEMVYDESYNNNEAILRDLRYIQRQRLSGSGVNVKFGAIARPIEDLRIGVSIHTPTYISMEEEYIERMAANFTTRPSQGFLSTPFAVNHYKIHTPTRLLTGISYTFRGIGLITADYERAWYNGMRLRGTGSFTVEDDMRQEIRTNYQAANNFRVGLELKPLDNFFLRGGYASYGRCIQSDALIAWQPEIKSYENFSGGIGYRFDAMYIDFTYVRSCYKYADHDIFFFQDGDFIIDSGIISNKANRDSFILTLGAKF